jgi:hypothetical protein
MLRKTFSFAVILETIAFFCGLCLNYIRRIPMNSQCRNALCDAIKAVLCPPLFYTEFVLSSTMETKGRKTKDWVEHFSVKVTVGIRPLVISDYKRSLTTIGKQKILIFAEPVIIEKEVVTNLLNRITNERCLLRPQYVVEESMGGSLVFKFQ